MLVLQPVSDIVDDHQIQPSIPVKIENSGARGPAGVVGDARLGDVGEGAVAVVAPELIDSPVGHVQVYEAVAGGEAHAVAGGLEPARFGDVGEMQRARFDEIVAVEPVLIDGLMSDN